MAVDELGIYTVYHEEVPRAVMEAEAQRLNLKLLRYVKRKRMVCLGKPRVIFNSWDDDSGWATVGVKVGAVLA